MRPMTESGAPTSRPAPPAAWAGLGAEPGLCQTCRHAKLNQTRRGTAYLRCGRAAWDERLVRYPRLPVLACPGFERLTEEEGQVDGAARETAPREVAREVAGRMAAAAADW